MLPSYRRIVLLPYLMHVLLLIERCFCTADAVLPDLENVLALLLGCLDTKES
jgi:hypothetical protein